MSEALLAIVALAILASHVWANLCWSRERARLTAAVVAPTPAGASAALRTTPVVPPPPPEVRSPRPPPIGAE